MVSYEQLDLIADSYNPLLLAIAGLLLLIRLSAGDRGEAKRNIVILFLLLGSGYAVMFFEQAIRLFGSIGLDFSTHTAVALALITALQLQLPRLSPIWWLSLLGYLLLMLYQGYHTLADLLVTTSLLVPTYLLLLFLVTPPSTVADQR